LGVADGSISKWERGVFRVGAFSLKKAAITLETSVEYLLGETDDPSPPGYPDGYSLSLRQGNLLAPHDIEVVLASLHIRNTIVVRALPDDFSASCGDGVDWQKNKINYTYTFIDVNSEFIGYAPVFSMQMPDDSMEPYIPDGESVVFSGNQEHVDSAPNGSSMLVNYAGRMLVRGVFRQQGNVTLRAWNQNYKEITLTPDDEFRVCGLVLMVYPSPYAPRVML
jgi:hypothetical protein